MPPLEYPTSPGISEQWRNMADEEPQPERVIGMPERWLVFYHLVDTQFFAAILHGRD